MKKIILLLIINFCFLIQVVFAASSSFYIKKIEMIGLQRISNETVYSYLPVKVGDSLTSEKTSNIIKSLYNTGFFAHISLSRMDNTLIIHVVERPTIGQLKITGNSTIPKDKLTEVMNSVNVAEGRVYDPAILDRVKQSLLNQYYELGRYNARVDIHVSSMPRNRVLVQIIISEGLVAKVHGINIIGNHTFSEKELDKNLALSTPGLFTIFTQKDRYSEEKLQQSLENLRNFYLDHGYIRFKVISSQVEVTPDRKSIFITVVIDEGAQYTVSGFDVAGDLILPRDKVINFIKIKPGDVFTRKAVMDAEKVITDALGEKGYIFADVVMQPKMDDIRHQVFLVFYVKPGKLTYVRYITYSNNTKTNDVVLRREMEQMESSLAQTKLLQQSKRRLNRLPYIKEVEMSVQPVPESDDQVDINYKVTEDSAAAASFNIGYSQLDHFLIGAGLNQKNFLGTGNTLGFNFTRSRYQQFYGIQYVNPYFTPDGVSRALSFSYSRFEPKWNNSTQSYSTNQYTFADVYSFPLGQELGVFNRLQLGYGYENTVINLNSDPSKVSEQVDDFVEDHGRHFQQIDLISSFSRDSRDRYIFPTSGMLHSIGANVYLPAQKDGLTYYIIDYKMRSYYPLPYSFIYMSRAEIGYGNSNDGPTNFPFYKNFYAGGIDSVRGYEGNTLGPRDHSPDPYTKSKPTGGNLLVDGSLGLAIPNHLSSNLRTSVFVDAGNTYDTFDNKQYNGTGSGPIRFSSGLEADWLTPMGLIDISYARPLNHRQGDHDEYFQFALGANFG